MHSLLFQRTNHVLACCGEILLALTTGGEPGDAEKERAFASISRLAEKLALQSALVLDLIEQNAEHAGGPALTALTRHLELAERCLPGIASYLDVDLSAATTLEGGR